MWLGDFYALPMHLECRRQQRCGQGIQDKFKEVLTSTSEVLIDDKRIHKSITENYCRYMV